MAEKRYKQMLKVAVLCVLATVVVAGVLTDDECGLPSFTDRLPSDAQEKIQKIWKNYEDGEGCDKQHQATKEILDALPEDVRSKAMRSKGPAFLRDVTDDVRAQFDNLWKDHSIPREEKPEKFKELASKLLNAEQLKEFNKFHAALQRRREEFQKKVEQANTRSTCCS
ncbi:hypothetical protein OSTOST_15816 [Ostertagia ostertagi]